MFAPTSGRCVKRLAGGQYSARGCWQGANPVSTSLSTTGVSFKMSSDRAEALISRPKDLCVFLRFQLYFLQFEHRFSLDPTALSSDMLNFDRRLKQKIMQPKKRSAF